jgi:ubiquinone/menaquinone biosynthesis C-methylase UbiE
MPHPGSDDLAATLDRPGVHQGWEAVFRSAANERFFDEAFDVVVRELGLPVGATILDAGCGAGAHTIRLARRGFHVRSVDFSSSVLGLAAANVRAAGLADRVTLQRESLLHLSFADASFDAVLCWGVLMHVPEVERAIAELARVVRPGGMLVVSEGNAKSAHGRLLLWANRLRGRRPRQAPAGAEYELHTPDGVLLVRHANLDWLVAQFRGHGFALVRRFAGQFTELYSRTSSGPALALIHGWNRFWFRHLRAPGPAFGNILLLRKAHPTPRTEPAP